MDTTIFNITVKNKDEGKKQLTQADKCDNEK